MSLYLDTSIIVPLQLREPKSDLLHEWLTSISEPLAISDLAVAEFQSAISRYVRMGKLTEPVAKIVRGNFEQWHIGVSGRIENLPIDVRVAAKLVQDPFPRLVTPDAIHIATCQRLDMKLVAHDDDMIVHARRAGVSCLAP